MLDLGVLRPLDEKQAPGTDNEGALPFVATAQYSSPEYLFRLVAPSSELWTGLTFYQLGGLLHDLICREPLFDEEVRSQNRYVVAYAVATKRPPITADDVDFDLVLLARDALEKDLPRRLRLVSWDRFLAQAPSSVDELRKALRLGDFRQPADTTPRRSMDDQLCFVLRHYASSLKDLVDNVFESQGLPIHTRYIAEPVDAAITLNVAFVPARALTTGRHIEIRLDMTFTPDLSAFEILCYARLTAENGTILADFRDPVGMISVATWDTEAASLRERLALVLLQAYAQLVASAER